MLNVCHSLSDMYNLLVNPFATEWHKQKRFYALLCANKDFSEICDIFSLVATNRLLPQESNICVKAQQTWKCVNASEKNWKLCKRCRKKLKMMCATAFQHSRFDLVTNLAWWKNDAKHVKMLEKKTFLNQNQIVIHKTKNMNVPRHIDFFRHVQTTKNKKIKEKMCMSCNHTSNSCPYDVHILQWQLCLYSTIWYE